MSSISHVRNKAPCAGVEPGPKPVETFVSSGILAQIRQRHEWLTALQAAWQRYAGIPLASHTRPISYHSGRLLVHADSSIWADRVRQQHQRLMQTMRQHPLLEELREVTARVVPPQGVAQAATRGGAHLSAASAALINSAAASIADPELRAALQRLGTRTERKR